MQKAREKIRPPKGGQNLVKVLAICHLHLSDDTTKKFVKALKKLDKRQDEFHDSNLTAIAYTSDGDTYHIKVAAGEYSENDIAIEGACYSNAENLIHLLEK